MAGLADRAAGLKDYLRTQSGNCLPNEADVQEREDEVPTQLAAQVASNYMLDLRCSWSIL